MTSGPVQISFVVPMLFLGMFGGVMVFDFVLSRIIPREFYTRRMFGPLTGLEGTLLVATGATTAPFVLFIGLAQAVLGGLAWHIAFRVWEANRALRKKEKGQAS